ncbi:MAG: hypothetical protein PVH98_07735 [Gammaproteobacteria bacterium]|jgi:TPR repeat protein
MMNHIFSLRFVIVIVGVFLASSALSFVVFSESPQQTAPPDSDKLIDKALGLSLDGHYEKAFEILKPLADKDVTRAQLYLAVAYYHGNGVKRNIPKALRLFLDLEDKNYEPGIVNTYLNLIGSLQSSDIHGPQS